VNVSVPSDSAGGPSEPAIVAVDLTKNTRETTSLRSVSFSVSPGEVYCLLGGPGSGKTTVADIVLGLQQPLAGRVSVLGHNPVDDRPAVQSLVSFVDGRAALYPSMTPLHALRFFLRLAAPTDRSARSAYVRALRDMQVPDRFMDARIDTAPPSVAVGTVLAVAWLRRCPALVLDEPTAELDSRAADGLIDVLGLFRRRGDAILMTTSDVMVASQAADRLGVLKLGEKVVERSRAEIAAQGLTEFILQYFGRVKPHPNPVRRRDTAEREGDT
jgi:ABC-2 type transport system ATP-binding protein